MLLSVVIPVRNRSGTRLENCLRSLRWQSVDPSRFEIVISDFGSDAEHAESVRRLAELHDARIEVTDTDEVWNRSRALNVGLQAARGRFVFCTDADMIFDPGFLQTILDVHADTARDVMIHCRCHDLPSTVGERLFEVKDFDELLSAASVRPTRGTGACQSARRSFFFQSRGYDEKFKFWGYEDIDMTARARRAGLEVEWISDRAQMLHQWHPTDKRRRPLRYHVNRWRFRLTKWQVVKNAAGWGKLA